MQGYDQFDQPLPNTSFTLKILNQEVAALASLQVDIASGSAIIILRGVALGATEISVIAEENSSLRESEPLKIRITPPPVRIHAIKIEPSAIRLNRGARANQGCRLGSFRGNCS
ncbi:MAG: hypothetical protein WKF84_06485 [Pyrinomonadaceae bacterium]